MGNPRPRTGKVTCQLWCASATDWAEIQEATVPPVYEAVLAKTQVGASTTYLDAGCGSGMAASTAFALGADVSGFDAAENLLAIARERTPDAYFEATDLEELPYNDDTFDVVTGFNSFQYAGNPQLALQEASRVYKSDGVIVIMTWGEPEGMEAASLVVALAPLLPPPLPGAPGCLRFFER